MYYLEMTLDEIRGWTNNSCYFIDIFRPDGDKSIRLAGPFQTEEEAKAIIPATLLLIIQAGGLSSAGALVIVKAKGIERGLYNKDLGIAIDVDLKWPN